MAGRLPRIRAPGSVVAVDGDGRTVFGGVGQPDDLTYPRSSNKPFQALAMVRSGLGLDGELLALACASHSGEPFHIDGVRRILAGAGLTEDALQCTADLPLGDEARAAHLAAGGSRAPIYMNCSGKHARRCWPPASPTAGRPTTTWTPTTRSSWLPAPPWRTWPASASARSASTAAAPRCSRSR
ncbi:hypothetical protein GCM10018954_078290 [Kutzneria kofuensis]